MKKYCVIFSILFLASFAFQMPYIKVLAAPEAESNIILLIDNSGSMRDTDPNRLSISAASMLIDTAEENININVVGFGESIISNYQLVDNPSRERLKAELSNFRFNHNYTSLKDGLKEVISQLEKVRGEKTVIVLSDGKEDPSGGLSSAHIAELNSLMDKAYGAKVKVHTIGLSKYADGQMLERLAFKTGGDYFYCDNPAELIDIYSKVLGNANQFSTIENYTTDGKTIKEIKLSPYIDEIIIKVASCENKIPLVDITQNGKRIETSKVGDTYKIYRFKNNKEAEIKITAQDKAKNLVMVQIKSKNQLKINSGEHYFRIPRSVPLDIYAELELDKDILGLHMDKLEGKSRENINKAGNLFRFTFNKEKSGQYPALITAYDGDGNIIAVKSIDINVTDNPPFYYTNPFPGVVIEDKPFKVELKQLDGTKVENPNGEVIVQYEDRNEKFPLRVENGLLTGEINLKDPGDVKIITCINGVSNNESFSYYLPSFKLKVTDKPYVELEADKSKQILKEKATAVLTLSIKKSLLYGKEKVQILDSKNNKVGEFELDPEAKNSVKVQISPVEKGKNLVFLLKPQGDIGITDKISTSISVMSVFDFYFRWFKIPLIILLIISALAVAVVLFGNYQYKRFIHPYRVNKEIDYNIIPDNIENMLNIELSRTNKIKYLNLRKIGITCDEEAEDAIGEFVLSVPRGNKTIQGLNYFFKKNKLFQIKYTALMDEQEIFRFGEPSGNTVKYERDVEVHVKALRRYIRITFS